MDWNDMFFDTLEDNHSRAILSLLYTSHMYEKMVTQLLKPFEVSNEQYKILKILEDAQPKKLTLKEIQSNLINQTANSTRLVEKLRQKEYLKTAQNKDNRSKLDISITMKGLDLLENVEEPLENLERKLHKVITDKEAEKLTKILRKIQTIIPKEM